MDGDPSVPSKRARLEATDVSGLGNHVPSGDKEEEESRHSKQALVTDRMFSFKVSFCYSELGMSPTLLMLAVTMNCWSRILHTAGEPSNPAEQMSPAAQ